MGGHEVAFHEVDLQGDSKSVRGLQAASDLIVDVLLDAWKHAVGLRVKSG